MKGMILLSVVNCEGRLEDGAKADAPFIALGLLKALQSIGHVSLAILF